MHADACFPARQKSDTEGLPIPFENGFLVGGSGQVRVHRGLISGAGERDLAAVQGSRSPLILYSTRLEGAFFTYMYYMKSAGASFPQSKC